MLKSDRAIYSSDTPNGKKITIMLEEIGCDFKVTKIDLSKDEQFKPDFKKISPFGKIPVIIDHENGIMYLSLEQSLFI